MKEIFRPLDQYESEQYHRVKNKVFSKFSSGYITDLDTIISICLVVYEEHENVLKENIPKIDACSLISFVLEQYDEYARVNYHHHRFGLSPADEEKWLSYASHARRGMKYLMEYLCINNTTLKHTENDRLTDKDKQAILSRIFISIEEMCSTYMRIDAYKFLLDSVELYLDENKHTYFTVPQDSEPSNIIDVRYEKQEIMSIIPCVPYSIDIDKHSQVLEESFRKHLGLTYGQLINFLRHYIEMKTSSVNIIPKEKIISDLQNEFNITIEQANLVVNGFCLRKTNLENRALFNPKQEHRAYHRGFFEFVYNDIPVLVFSRVMALEALDILVNNTCYQKLPEEWKTPDVEHELTTLSNKAGKWFEKILHKNLNLVGVHAVSSINSYRWQGKIINIPEAVGEIDFIGYLPENNSLFVIEAKNVRFNTEPRLFRDDISKFMTGKKSYVEKFKAKCQWVTDNISVVIDEVRRRGVEVQAIDRIYKVMVILSPSPVEGKITEFSCVNLVKFMKIMESRDFSSISVVSDYQQSL